MKTILGSDKVPFEWANMEELRAEAKKYDVHIWSGVHIGNDVRIGDGVRIGNDVHIGDEVHIGGDAHIGNGVHIRNDVHIGSGVRIWNGALIWSGVRGAVVKNMHLTGLYKYSVDIIWTEEDVYIRLGCFTRTKTEWEGDFWNNDSEFPQESLGGKRRWNAFKVCLQIIENEN